MLGMTKDGGGLSAGYYSQDNYYSKDGDPDQSEWLGKGAEAAGLRPAGKDGVTVQGPKIDGKVFNELQAGRMPDGTTVKGPDKRTPGWDLTASAPKSVSVMALVAGDARLVKAHRQASAAAAQYLERHAGTRVKVDGKAVHKHTGNLLIGRYTHDTSRAKDPALHDHLYVHNATYDASTGKWRAVDSTQLYQAKEAASRIYMAELAQNVVSAGYKITERDRHGNFEIEGVPEQLIDRFSKRKAEIDAKVAESNDPNSRKARERAALLTRDAKTSAIETEAKREAWRKEAGKELSLIDRLRDAAVRGAHLGRLAGRNDTLGEGRGVVERVVAPIAQKIRAGFEVKGGARETLQYAIAHVTERKAVFSEADLVTAALSRRGGAQLDPRAIVTEIERAYAQGSLIRTGDKPEMGLTTDKILASERFIIRSMKEQASTWSLGKAATDQEARISLSDDQGKAFKVALEGEQRYAAIVGYAGTGKSYLVSKIRDALERSDPDARVLALAPMHKQVADFREELGLETNTIAGFIAENRSVLNASSDKKPDQDLSKTLVVVDEAGMNSNEQAAQLVKLFDKMGVGRVVMLGDPRQKSSPAQGAPFAAMLKANIPKAEMRDIRRQKTPTFRNAAFEAATGRVSKALETLGEHVRSTGDAPLEAAAVQHWRSLRPDQRQDALIVSTTLERRDRLNAMIRDAKINDPALSPEERLSAKAYEASTLISKRLTKAQLNTGNGLAAGDQLLFHRDLRRIGIKKGDQLTLVSIDKKQRQATLAKADGSKVKYRFLGLDAKSTAFEAYTRKQIEIREGEKLAWSKSDRQQGIRAGTTVSVVSFDRTHVTLRDEQGRLQTLERTNPILQHVNYTYSRTSFASQGATKDVVIAVTGVGDRLSGDQAHSYVAMSRVGGKDKAAEHLAIFTEDKKQLMDRYRMQLMPTDSALIASNDPLLGRDSVKNPLDGSNGIGFNKPGDERRGTMSPSDGLAPAHDRQNVERADRAR